MSEIEPVLQERCFLDRFEPLLRIVDGGSQVEEESQDPPPPSSAVIPLFESQVDLGIVSEGELLAQMTSEQRRIYMQDIYGEAPPLKGGKNGVYLGLLLAAVLLSFVLPSLWNAQVQDSAPSASVTWSTAMAPLEARTADEEIERRKRRPIVLYR